MRAEPWRAIADEQAGLVTRAQLNRVGVDRWAVRHRIESERWQELTPTVVATTSGELTRDQAMWLGVLHDGPEALLGDVAAAEAAGLQGWRRDRVTVLVPHGADVGQGHPDLEFRWVRRPLARLRQPGGGVPRCRLEPAVLLFASRQRSSRRPRAYWRRSCSSASPRQSGCCGGSTSCSRCGARPGSVGCCARSTAARSR